MSAALALELAPLSEKPRLGKKVAKPRLVWENPALSAGKHKGNSKVKGRSSYGRVLYMNARVYDASIGRFMSADTIVPDPFHTQDFNRYSYVRNNPLRYTDPTGHVSCLTTLPGWSDDGESYNFSLVICFDETYDERDYPSGGPNGPGAPPPNPVSSGDGDVTAPPPHTSPAYRSAPFTGGELNENGTLAGMNGISGPSVSINVVEANVFVIRGVLGRFASIILGGGADHLAGGTIGSVLILGGYLILGPQRNLIFNDTLNDDDFVGDNPTGTPGKGQIDTDLPGNGDPEGTAIELGERFGRPSGPPLPPGRRGRDGRRLPAGQISYPNGVQVRPGSITDDGRPRVDLPAGVGGTTDQPENIHINKFQLNQFNK